MSSGTPYTSIRQCRPGVEQLDSVRKLLESQEAAQGTFLVEGALVLAVMLEKYGYGIDIYRLLPWCPVYPISYQGVVRNRCRSLKKTNHNLTASLIMQLRQGAINVNWYYLLRPKYVSSWRAPMHIATPLIGFLFSLGMQFLYGSCLGRVLA